MAPTQEDPMEMQALKSNRLRISAAPKQLKLRQGDHPQMAERLHATFSSRAILRAGG